jgi:hypothetical protein
MRTALLSVVNKDHGRIEIRRAWVLTDLKLLWALRGSEKWPDLATVIFLARDYPKITIKIY